MPRPVALIILDGFGLAPDSPGNAVSRAATHYFDRYRESFPATWLQASGRAVGLPEGQIGNSEVGHLNIGAGRVVLQSLSFIREQVATGAFFENKVLNDTFGAAGGTVHLIGLVSRGGVHSDLEHLFALLELARRKGVGPVYVHAFTDGRDTPPDSGLGHIRELQQHIEDLGHDIHVASVSGRYFAMDRDHRWTRTKKAFDAVVCGRADYRALTGVEAVEAGYIRGETDEFLEPTVIVRGGAPVGPIRDGDTVVCFNFRADRARQLTYALLGDASWGEFRRCRKPEVRFASLMQIDTELSAPYAFGHPSIHNGLAEVLSLAALRQCHAAETEKYAHVTYFFNARREEPFPGEDRHLVPSPRVATYDLKPEMSAPGLAESMVERIRGVNDDFILVNFANPDMVGHTGILDATIKACEATDEGMGKIVEAVRAKGGTAVIIADHGNAEAMIAEDGGPHTAHTTNPVPCIVVSDDRKLRLRKGGVLGDVAPTVLELLGLSQPKEMTGRSLLGP